MDNTINIAQSKYDDAISDSIYGSCPTKLTKCAKCGVLGQKINCFGYHGWSLTLKCETCDSHWTICTQYLLV